MTFALPWLGYLAAATPMVLAVVFAIDFTRRRRTLDRISDPEVLRRMLATLSVRRRVVKAILFITGVTALVTAVARPQVEGESTWRQRGIDVAVVVDFSKSMLAEDIYPNRFRRALVELDQLVDGLDADRVAVVAAAGNAEYFPLTHDAEAIRSFFAGIAPGDMRPGSDLGAAVVVARCVLIPERAGEECARIGTRVGGGGPLGSSDSLAERARTPVPIEDRGRALVILTDGGDTGGRFVDEIATSAAAGIHVYVVGIGTEAGELIPELDADGKRAGWQRQPESDAFVTTRLERAALDAATAAAGKKGQLFLLGKDGLRRADLLAKLQTLKKGNLDERVVAKRVEVYHWFLFPGLLLLIIEACIRERRRQA